MPKLSVSVKYSFTMPLHCFLICPTGVSPSADKTCNRVDSQNLKKGDLSRTYPIHPQTFATVYRRSKSLQCTCSLYSYFLTTEPVPGKCKALSCFKCRSCGDTPCTRLKMVSGRGNGNRRFKNKRARIIIFQRCMEGSLSLDNTCGAADELHAGAESPGTRRLHRRCRCSMAPRCAARCCPTRRRCGTWACKCSTTGTRSHIRFPGAPAPPLSEMSPQLCSACCAWRRRKRIKAS